MNPLASALHAALTRRPDLAVPPACVGAVVEHELGQRGFALTERLLFQGDRSLVDRLLTCGDLKAAALAVRSPAAQPSDLAAAVAGQGRTVQVTLAIAALDHPAEEVRRDALELVTAAAHERQLGRQQSHQVARQLHRWPDLLAGAAGLLDVRVVLATADTYDRATVTELPAEPRVADPSSWRTLLASLDAQLDVADARLQTAATPFARREVERDHDDLTSRAGRLLELAAGELGVWPDRWPEDVRTRLRSLAEKIALDVWLPAPGRHLPAELAALPVADGRWRRLHDRYAVAIVAELGERFVEVPGTWAVALAVADGWKQSLDALTATVVTLASDRRHRTAG